MMLTQSKLQFVLEQIPFDIARGVRKTGDETQTAMSLQSFSKSWTIPLPSGMKS